jgi:hypothetical protein
LSQRHTCECSEDIVTLIMPGNAFQRHAHHAR